MKKTFKFRSREFQSCPLKLSNVIKVTIEVVSASTWWPLITGAEWKFENIFQFSIFERGRIQSGKWLHHHPASTSTPAMGCTILQVLKNLFHWWTVKKLNKLGCFQPAFFFTPVLYLPLRWRVNWEFGINNLRLAVALLPNTGLGKKIFKNPNSS